MIGDGLEESKVYKFKKDVVSFSKEVSMLNFLISRLLFVRG